MVAIKVNQFGGMLPSWDPRLLPDGQSQKSVNGFLFGGNLVGWRMPTALRNLTNPAATFAYRIPGTSFDNQGIAHFDTTITNANQTWLEFTDPDTSVQRSQVVNDVFQRYYVAAPTQNPPLYNTLNRIQSNQNFFNLGIPAPAQAPGVGVSGGGNLATIGPTASVGGGATIGANVMYLLPIVPTGACVINSLEFMPLATNASEQFFAAVYADAAVGGNAATVPSQLLAATGVVTGVTATVLASATFNNPVALNSNTPYWVGICLSTPLSIAFGDGVNGSGYFLSPFGNGAPGTAGTLVPNQPDLQMFVNVTTSSVLESRTYVYTYVSAYGEEGPPSPPTLLTGWSNGIWTITPTGPPSNYFGGNGNGNIAFLRIYRTVTSAAGAATYFQVADISVGSSDPDAVAAVSADALGCLPPASTYTDILPDSTVALNLQLPSTNYFAPPTNLQDLKVLPNGMYVGFVGNQIWFSVPYLPHAWPPGFVYTVDFPVVGLGITSGALVVVTNGAPWVFNGTNPASLSQVRCAFSEPCLSRGSIVATDTAVFYQSINGLIAVTAAGQMSNATEPWVMRDKWDQLTPLKYLRAIPLVGEYFGFGSVSPPSVSPQNTSFAQTGFTIDLSAADATSFTIWPQAGGHRLGFGEMQAPNAFNITNVLLDPWTGIGMLIQNGAVYYYDFTNTMPVIQPCDWTSKIYQLGAKGNLSAFKVWFNVPAGSPGQNLQPKTDPPTDPGWQTLGPNAWAYVLIYADVDDGDEDGSMQLICAREITRSGGLYRIPDGFKAESWAVRILSRVIVSNLQIASSPKELARV